MITVDQSKVLKKNRLFRFFGPPGIKHTFLIDPSLNTHWIGLELVKLILRGTAMKVSCNRSLLNQDFTGKESFNLLITTGMQMCSKPTRF